MPLKGISSHRLRSATDPVRKYKSASAINPITCHINCVFLDMTWYVTLFHFLSWMLWMFRMLANVGNVGNGNVQRSRKIMNFSNDKIVNVTLKFEHSSRECSNVGNVKKTFNYTW